MNIPALPGETAKLHIYPDPDPDGTGEMVRSHRRQTHHIMYRDHEGKFVLFSPPPKHLDTYTKPEPLPAKPTPQQLEDFRAFVPAPIETPHADYLAKFASNLLSSFGKDEHGHVITKAPVYQGLRLVSRAERREMYRADRKRYKQARAKSRAEGLAV